MGFRSPWNRTRTVFEDVKQGLGDVDDLCYDSGSDLDQLTLSDLSNEVHPIFAPTNFPEADYAKLFPALRLASRFVDTDCLLDFWYGIFFGVELPVRHGESMKDWHMAFFRPRTELSAVDRAMTRFKLRRLADIVLFNRMTPQEDYINGRTFAYLDIVAQALSGDGGLAPGVRTQILYSGRWYKSMCGLHSADRETQRREYFEFASMLVHEVAHAAYYAACGANSYELPFEFNTVSETGYDWEAFGFGGIIGHGHTVIDWSSPSRCKEYTKNGWSIWLQDDPPDVEFEAH